MNDVEDRREFLESLGIKTDGFHGIGEQYTAIHSLIYAKTALPARQRRLVNLADVFKRDVEEMLAACFFCIRKQQEQIAELKERLK